MLKTMGMKVKISNFVDAARNNSKECPGDNQDVYTGMNCQKTFDYNTQVYVAQMRNLLSTLTKEGIEGGTEGIIKEGLNNEGVVNNICKNCEAVVKVVLNASVDAINRNINRNRNK